MDASAIPGPASLDTLAEKLAAHEHRSQERYEALCEKLTTTKESNMGEGIMDKVNINVGEGRGGGGGDMAAVIAALGSRNQGGDIAGLIAALGGRNEGGGMAAMLPALLAGQNGGGMNNMWPILLLALLGRGGRGGLLGGGDDCGPVAGGVTPAQAAILQTLLEGQSDLRAQVPTTALETQNAVQAAIAQLALAGQQGFSNVKDSVQNTAAVQLAATAGVKDSVQSAFAILNQNILDQGCKGREATQASTNAILSKLDQNTIDDLRDRVARAERSVEVNSLRSQVEVNQTVTSTNAQAQGQFQSQRQGDEILHRLRCIESGHNQLSSAVSRITQFGTGNVAVPNNSSTNQQG